MFNIKQGTLFVVCAVLGDSSLLIINSALPWSAIIIKIYPSFVLSSTIWPTQKSIVSIGIEISKGILSINGKAHKLIILDDSKKLTRFKRLKAIKFISELKQSNIINFALGYATVEEIDAINILEATKLSIRRSVYKLNYYKGNIVQYFFPQEFQ